jgi:integrase/recombinase XerC
MRVLYRWLEEEEELPNPMARMKPPIIPERPIPIVPDDGLRRLLAACAGKGFEARRDTAIIVLLLDTGARRAELADLQLALSIATWTCCWYSARVVESGHCRSGTRPVRPWSATFASAPRHKHAELPWLWIGLRGRLTAYGVVMMLRRRGRQAGLPSLHPHQFRHTFAHQWLAEGGGETDLMRLAGWKSRQMLQRHGASAADARARDAHRPLSTVGEHGELAEERRAVARAIAALRLTPVLFEQGARPHPPQDRDRARLTQSDGFIGRSWRR